MRLRAEEGFVDLGHAAECGHGRVERVVQRLRSRLALGVRVGQAVLAWARLTVERVAVALEQRLRVLARRALQHTEDLIDLNRRVGLRDRDPVARAEVRLTGAARLQVDEEVALEEDARTNLRLRVSVE